VPTNDMQATVQVAIAQTETSAVLTATAEPTATASQTQVVWPTPGIEPSATPQQFAISIPDLLATLERSAANSRAPSGRFVVPNDGYVYMQVKHDFETDLWHHKPRAYSINGWNPENNPNGGFPDTFPMYAGGGGRDHVRLTESFQWLWFDLLRQASALTIPDSVLKERWAEITEHGRALTDSFAVQQGYRDYVLQQNMDAQDIQQKILTMGGNIVRIVGSDKNNWYVEAISTSQPAPNAAEIIKKPWLVHWGTQSSIQKLGSVYEVTDWGQLNYEGVQYGVPFMLLSPNGQLQIKKEFLKPIENGAEYSPYDP